MKLNTSIKTLIFFSAAATSSAQQIGDALVQPAFVSSGDTGLLDVSLTLEYAEHNTAAHDFEVTRLFNGTMPGPTLKVRAGDTMRILFKNQLVDQGHEHVENTYGVPDTSNLHFHGAHVSGELPSDDVTYRVEPQEEYQYETHFPAIHMAGTHWIHPHVHGSGALQVGGGAAMALIVEDEPGALPPEVESAKDILLFVQHMNIGTLEGIAEDSGDDRLSIAGGIRGVNNYRLVNGQYQPTLTMQPGEWQRWRIVYGAWDRDALDFTIDDYENNGCEMNLLAKDGIYIDDYPRRIAMAPIPTAGRADIMVRCPNAGSFEVHDFSGQTLISIDVTGNTVLSDNLDALTNVPFAEYLGDFTNTAAGSGCECDTRFQIGCGDNGEHCVNNFPFDASRYLHKVVLGEVIERDLRGVNAHPYHQHVYPFQIVDGIDSLTGDHATYFQVGDWHDVLMIDQLGGGDEIKMRYKATEHLGRLMLHCHRLDHEDQGMMAWEEVVDSGTCGCNVNEERAFITPAPISATTPTPAETTPGPTPGPTLEPTTPAPVSGPTPGASSECSDNADWTFTTPRGIGRSTTLGNDPSLTATRCDRNADAGSFENCPVTCSTCPVNTPAPTPASTPATNTPGPTGPTLGPTPGPSPTPRPTSAPSLRGTPGPTLGPTPRPTPVATEEDVCEDRDSWSATFNTRNGSRTITCNNVIGQNNNNSCNRADSNGVTGNTACPVTCGTCGTIII